MTRLPALIPALVYTAFAAFANPALARPLTEAERAEVMALREGDMRKLVVHEAAIPAPDTVFTDPEGAEMSLADSDGRIRLVNFWATWCAPCRIEKPALDALERDLGGPDFEVIAIATGRNSLEAIEDFNAEVGVTVLATHLDPKGALAAAMNVPGLPVTVILDRDGAEIGRLMGGADWDAASARAIVSYLAGLD
ncbi:MAG TPA: TlpA disulfide reductase family protein [Amaricoccus sp.]|uniref:TlpA family protein disulfide reductase n=1 Tax=Amaricoccus sp. TaxID=1872485 RepID=UPI002CFAD2AB|nr:TlpA disulfide reductase family protein [Amaricoccus sp.]HMQ93445.1 TlpA disulfide reductase family protein [Amaricoccus sp.]HMR54041.1 TlpA disulfide reductase family protein [Amaricoccus sp.]HMR61257.1 TlpA disulfide reductase family protein [Amaricoccus sp.]HMU01030.1 TlpA disulfide reductase family protein [Amaricoccus sp.]